MALHTKQVNEDGTVKGRRNSGRGNERDGSDSRKAQRDAPLRAMYVDLLADAACFQAAIEHAQAEHDEPAARYLNAQRLHYVRAANKILELIGHE